MVESANTGTPGIDAQPPSDGIKETVNFAVQLEHAIAACLVPGTNPVLHELGELDRLYREAGASAAPFVEATARRLFAEPQAFDNLNFQSSFLSGGSQFFGTVLRKMGELAEHDPQRAEGIALPVQIRLVEHFRRGGNGNEMDKYASQVEATLQTRIDDGDPLALAQLAKVRYEQSMYAFGQKDYEGSMARGEESANLCERGGDIYGVLAARGNTAGLCRYTLVKERGEHPENERLLNEGKSALLADLATAQAEMQKAEAGTSAHLNFVRTEMNNAAHLIHIAALQDDLEAARNAMRILEQNPLFQAAFDPAHPGDYEHAQKWILPYPAIIKKLEARGQ